MPLFGAHTSVAGGLHNALLAARAHGMESVQLFTANPNRWTVTPPEAGASPRPEQFAAEGADRRDAHALADDAVRLFRRTFRGSGLRCAVAHDSYLINLASPDEALYRRSLEAFVGELRRAERLGLRYLVTHPGAHVGSGEAAGLARVAAALDEVHARCAGFRVRVLLETTAGQGSALGWRFEHLAAVLARVAAPRRLGVCFDTCHVFAAGYALAPLPEYRATLKAFDRAVGLKWLRVFHVNDSVRELGSRVDRHAHLGRGRLGLEPFRLLVNDARFRNRPMILETPKEDGPNDDMDAVNLGVLRALVRPAGGT